MHDVRLAIEAGLSGTGTTNDNGIEIPSVDLAIESNSDILAEKLVFKIVLASIFPVYI